MWATDREHLTSQIGKITVWLGMPRHCLRQNFYASSGHHFPVHRCALSVAKTAVFCHKSVMVVRICAPTFADNREKVGALTGAFWKNGGLNWLSLQEKAPNGFERHIDPRR